jgi:hypothetical protein
MEDNWISSTKPAPVDEEQFVQSFEPHDVANWKPFLSRFGFVVINNVLSAAEVQDAEDAFWKEMANKGNGKVDKNDCKAKVCCVLLLIVCYQTGTTWEDENWPSQSKFLSEKAVGQSAFDVRTNQAIYDIFCQIFEETKLLCNVDNYGIMRGTVFDLEQRPGWRVSLEPHWDVDPWRYSEVTRFDKIVLI